MVGVHLHECNDFNSEKNSNGRTSGLFENTHHYNQKLYTIKNYKTYTLIYHIQVFDRLKWKPGLTAFKGNYYRKISWA